MRENKIYLPEEGVQPFSGWRTWQLWLSGKKRRTVRLHVGNLKHLKMEVYELQHIE
ncbi:MAG: hypothetical protein DHS20C07_01930 [Methyloligella sp.]|nr:MAG: hypothetical protein DHS20C07_01930 [Methyloligella sp.]